MDRTRFGRWLAAARRSARRLHAGGVSAQQRLHFATLLIVLAAPLRAQDIQFNPATTQDEFAQFSRTMGQAIFATPVQPARATSLLGWDVGIAATLVKVDQNASWWRHAVPANNDFLTGGGYAAVPRLVAIKGFGPITPYAAIGRQRTNATGTVTSSSQTLTLDDRGNINRYTAGVRFSLLVPKIASVDPRAVFLVARDAEGIVGTVQSFRRRCRTSRTAPTSPSCRSIAA